MSGKTIIGIDWAPGMQEGTVVCVREVGSTVFKMYRLLDGYFSLLDMWDGGARERFERDLGFA